MIMHLCQCWSVGHLNVVVLQMLSSSCRVLLLHPRCLSFMFNIRNILLLKALFFLSNANIQNICHTRNVQSHLLRISSSARPTAGASGEVVKRRENHRVVASNEFEKSELLSPEIFSNLIPSFNTRLYQHNGRTPLLRRLVCCQQLKVYQRARN